mgnify:CR=1 FL=1
MICVSEIEARCENMRPFTGINDELASVFVSAVSQGLSIEFIYECLGLSALKSKKLIRRSEVMMRCPIIYAICATCRSKRRKTPKRKARLVFLENKIFGTFAEAKEYLVVSESYRWMRRSYANAKYSGMNSVKGVIYVKHKRLAVVETIKPLVFMINVYEVS